MNDAITWADLAIFTLTMIPANVAIASKSTVPMIAGFAWAVTVWAYVLLG